MALMRSLLPMYAIDNKITYSLRYINHNTNNNVPLPIVITTLLTFPA